MAKNVNLSKKCWVMEGLPAYCTELFKVDAILLRQEYLTFIQDVLALERGEINAFKLDEPNLSEDRNVDPGAPPDTSTPIPVYPQDSFTNPFSNLPPVLKSKLLQGLILSGQPGIGKSALLPLILVLRLHAHLPTILIDDPTTSHIFTGEGVFSLRYDAIDGAQLRVCLPKNTWILFDSNLSTIYPDERLLKTNFFILQAASPRKGRLDWRKKAKAKVWFMKPWTFPEILMARSLQVEPVTECDLETFWEKYAPSARVAFQYAAQPDEQETLLLEQIRGLEYDLLRNILKAADDFAMNENVSHSIIRFDPDQTRGARVSVASRHVFDEIMTSVVQGNAQRIADLYSLFLHSAYSRGTAGWVLDTALHDLLVHRRQWPVAGLGEALAQTKYHWKSVLNPNVEHLILFSHNQVAILRQSSLPAEQVAQIPQITYELKDLPNLVLKSGYYQPVQRTQATFDSFIYDETRKLAVLFQATVSTQHLVKSDGLKALQKLGVAQFWYVAVTPEQAIDFTPDNDVVNSKLVKKRLHIRVKPSDFLEKERLASQP